MDTPDWGLGNWGQGTTYAPTNAFFNRDTAGNPVGLAPGAFRSIGAGLQGAGAGLMTRGRSPGEMAAMGIANGANTWQRQQQQQNGGLQPGGPMSGIGLIKSMFGGQGGQGGGFKPMGAFQLFGGGGQ